MKFLEYLVDIFATPSRIHRLELAVAEMHQEILKNREELEKLQKSLIRAFLE